ncbi:hypothetical protein PBOI14_37020 [Pseudomonas sp. Boi14]|nr:hypothetical protein PBOI14_37020 [Pseudomonas sp. Boi14]
MDNLNGLQVFVSVVQSGSLVGAGERLGCLPRRWARPWRAWSSALACAC